MSKVLDRVADAGGILYVLLVFGGYVFLVAPFMPESLDSPDAALAHLQAHPPTTAFWAGIWLEGAGLAVLVLFAARIASRIRAAQPGWWLPLGGARARRRRSRSRSARSRPGWRRWRSTGSTPDGHRPAEHQRRGGRRERALDGAFVLLLGLGALAVGGCRGGWPR